ncbi:helix-turn-helix transcriptional regulator [Enterocloster sp. OA13]|uniref:helix-turn-helix domain-containing protein n=1 Tax=Enterocloster sp. OA13 TaxID=2914161 RepID=UPI00138AAEEB|nr:helix-turn-helix transcriptional regulator [Enterocloster sp. OA13]
MEEKEISEKLLCLRKKASLSQVEVSRELGISRQTLSKWETGKSCPDAIFIKKISEIYKVSIDELMDNNYNLQNEKISDVRKKQSGNICPRIWLLFVIIDFLICFVLVCMSTHMLFWVLDFNFILLAIFLLVRLINFIKAKMD